MAEENHQPRNYVKTSGSRARLREAISSGEFLAGTYLPSARDLARQLKISKSSVHNILKLLQDEGLIQIYPGCGALVLGNSQPQKRLHRIFVRPSDFGTYKQLPVTSKLLQSTAASAERYNIEMMLSFSDSGRLTDEIIAHYINGLVQGVLYLECQNFPELIEPLYKAQIPCVIAADHQNHTEAVRTYVDFRATARQAVRHLIECGHRQIGIITGNANDFLYHEMLSGYRGALAEENLPIVPEWQLTNLSFDQGEKAQHTLANFFAQHLAGQRPSAFFTVRDYRAKWLYQVAEQLHISIPEELSVLSFDNHTWSEAGLYGLSSWDEPLAEQGEQAIKLLSSWVSTGERPESRELRSSLIERHSVRPFQAL